MKYLVAIDHLHTHTAVTRELIFLPRSECISRHVVQDPSTSSNPVGYPTGPPFGPVSPSEQPDRPGFRSNFSHCRPIGRHLKPNPIRAVLRLCKTRPTYVRAGLTTPRTDQMYGPMPILGESGEFSSLWEPGDPFILICNILR